MFLRHAFGGFVASYLPGVKLTAPATSPYRGTSRVSVLGEMWLLICKNFTHYSQLYVDEVGSKISYLIPRTFNNEARYRSRRRYKLILRDLWIQLKFFLEINTTAPVITQSTAEAFTTVTINSFKQRFYFIHLSQLHVYTNISVHITNIFFAIIASPKVYTGTPSCEVSL